MITLFIGYLFIVLVLYRWHERIVFQPVTLEDNYEFHFDQAFTELHLPLPSTVDTVSALHFPPPPDSTKGIVLYFHGNADNLQRWGQYAVDFTRHGYEVLAIDYPGYGKSGGVVSEEAVYRSAALAFSWALERFPPEQIIIYGRSLGSGPAAWLAARHEVRQLILETPFPSMAQLFRMRATAILVPFAPRVNFPVAEYIQQVNYPVTIFQGTDDWVVPYRVARRLQTFLKPGDQFFIIEGGGHKNLRNFPEYQEQLEAVLW